MSLPEKQFESDYYDENYFAVPKGKKFPGADGKMQGWSYANPEGEWTGCEPIVKAWKEMFNPVNMLDVGAGRGTFIAYARDVGIKAVGFDYSKWAVGSGRYKRCKPEWLKMQDATRYWPYKEKQFDLVVALDFYEHIYETDLDHVKKEMFFTTKKWLFLQIAVAGSGGLQGESKDGYSLKKGEPVPKGLEGVAVAGHVNVRPEQYWIDYLEHDEFMLRRDMKNFFCGLVSKPVIQNWLLNSILIFERVTD